MKDRKFHSNKELKDNYPKPSVPADEAWAEMNKMLGPGIQVPPKQNPGSLLRGLRKFFWHYIVAITVVSIIVVVNLRKNNENKTSPTSATPALSANGNEIPDTQTTSYNKVNPTADKIVKPNDENITSNDADSTIDLPPAITETQPRNNAAEKDKAVEKNTIPLLSHDTVNSLSGKNNEHGMGNSTVNDHGNTALKSNSATAEKKQDHKRYDKNDAGKLSPYRRSATKNHDRDIAHTTLKAQNNFAVHDRQNPSTLSNDKKPSSTNKHLLSEITPSESSLPGAIVSFIQEAIATDIPGHLVIDSANLEKMISAANVKTAKKHSKGKAKSTSKNSIQGLEYGLQWDVVIPVQGTKNYFSGANGDSKPYNIMIPQLWLSKGINKNSKIFFKVNTNQQYFTGNKKLAADTAAFPLDSTFHKISLSRVGGFGATLQYSYRIHKNWSASIGINYNVNRNALLNKEEISRYTGFRLSDSLVGIKRSSADWHYINNSQVTGNLELFYTFKKIALGAEFYLPLSNIPVFGNKNIHPVNARIFLRWNIKKK